MIVSKPRRLGGWWGAPALFLAPALVLFVVLFAFPAASSLYVSMCRWSGFTPHMEFVGLHTFGRLAADMKFWNALRNNFWIMGAGGVVFFGFALVFAAALNDRNLRGRKFFQTLIFFPSFISAVGVATFWKLLYDSKSGLLNLSLEGLGASPVQWLASDNAINAAVIMLVWAEVGGMMILLLAGMRRIPKDYYEAAEIDGASGGQRFLYVTVPMMREVMLIALSLWMIGSMKVFGFIQGLLAPDINDNCQVVSTLQYDYAFNNRRCIFLMGEATAMAVVQVAIVLVLVGIVRLLREKKSVEY
jgi:ABC-type sugar transport system permease subunit